MPVDKDGASAVLEWMESSKGGEARIINQLEAMTGGPLSIPFISPTLTWATTGGAKIGHFNRWFGPEGCLDEDTFLQYEIRTQTGDRQNHKGGTIKRLYERFHHIGGYQRKETLESEFFLSCMNDEGKIFQNRIQDVVDSGLKWCFDIRTVSGEIITSTSDHKFFTGTAYKKLQDLRVGDFVYIHNNTRYKVNDKPRISRPETTVKHHPIAPVKIVNGYKYHRIRESRLAAEAAMNGLSIRDYTLRLNNNILEGLLFIPSEMDVHHKDEDYYNNDFKNLEIIDPIIHNRHHAIKSHNNLRFTAVADQIVSITPVGIRHTYDVKMLAPYHNFVANRFVVHNSGKSLSNWGIAYNAQNYPMIMTERYEREIHFWEKKSALLKPKIKKLKQRLDYILKKFPDGMNVMIFDTEQRAVPAFGVRMGVNMQTENCVIIEQNVIEYIIDEIKKATGSYHVFMIDSVSNGQSMMQAGLEPGEEDRASAAKAWTRLRQVRRNWDRTENTLILVDQLRAQGIGGRGSTKPIPSQARFLKHNISLDIEFDRGTKLYLNDKMLLVNDKDKGSNDYKNMGADGKQVAGLEMKAHVEKNSTGKPFRDSVMRFKFDVTKPATGEVVQEIGFDESYELLKIAEYYHVIDAGGGGMFYLLDDKFNKVKGRSWKGEWNACKALVEDEELKNILLTRCQLDT